MGIYLKRNWSRTYSRNVRGEKFKNENYFTHPIKNVVDLGLSDWRRFKFVFKLKCLTQCSLSLLRSKLKVGKCSIAINLLWVKGTIKYSMLWIDQWQTKGGGLQISSNYLGLKTNKQKTKGIKYQGWSVLLLEQYDNERRPMPKRYKK